MITDDSQCDTFSLHTLVAATFLQHRLAALLQTIKQAVQLHLQLQSQRVKLEHPRCLLCASCSTHCRLWARRISNTGASLSAGRNSYDRTTPKQHPVLSQLDAVHRWQGMPAGRHRMAGWPLPCVNRTVCLGPTVKVGRTPGPGTCQTEQNTV